MDRVEPDALAVPVGDHVGIPAAHPLGAVDGARCRLSVLDPAVHDAADVGLARDPAVIVPAGGGEQLVAVALGDLAVVEGRSKQVGVVVPPLVGHGDLLHSARLDRHVRHRNSRAFQPIRQPPRSRREIARPGQRSTYPRDRLGEIVGHQAALTVVAALPADVGVLDRPGLVGIPRIPLDPHRHDSAGEPARYRLGEVLHAFRLVLGVAVQRPARTRHRAEREIADVAFQMTLHSLIQQTARRPLGILDVDRDGDVVPHGVLPGC